VVTTADESISVVTPVIVVTTTDEAISIIFPVVMIATSYNGVVLAASGPPFTDIFSPVIVVSAANHALSSVCGILPIIVVTSSNESAICVKSGTVEDTLPLLPIVVVIAANWSAAVPPVVMGAIAHHMATLTSPGLVPREGAMLVPVGALGSRHSDAHNERYD
jgi:hypothetical protein